MGGGLGVLGALDDSEMRRSERVYERLKLLLEHF